MKEIAKDIFIENNFSGVVVGAIRTASGQILIDAPFKVEDLKTWLSRLEEIGGGQQKLLINLDTHLDRTIGVKGVDCTVMMHQNAPVMIKSRPAAVKSQETEAVAFWESYDGLSSIRWVAPDMTFQKKLSIFWGTHEIELEHHPGANAAGLWVNLPQEQIIFIGDSVLVDEPPFLACADIELWLEDLKFLLSSRFRNYKIINGRDGQIDREDIRNMVKILKVIQVQLQRISSQKENQEILTDISRKVMRKFPESSEKEEIYLNRLKWGLGMYLKQHEAAKTLLLSEGDV